MASLKELQHIILLYLASILLIVALATNNWVDSWHSRVEASSGLFKACVMGICGKHGDEDAVKAMEIIGTIAAVFGAIAMTVHHGMKSDSTIKKLPKVVFITSVIGACLVFLGCVIYGFDRFEDDMYPGYSFALAVIGGILLLVGGVASSKK